MKTMTRNTILALAIVIIGCACNNEKNDEKGPVYRGEKGVVIRGSNEDDREQMNGHTDSLHFDSLRRPTNKRPALENHK